MHQHPPSLVLSGPKEMTPKDVLIGVCLCMQEETAKCISRHIMVVMIHCHILSLILGVRLVGINLCHIVDHQPFKLLLLRMSLQV